MTIAEVGERGKRLAARARALAGGVPRDALLLATLVGASSASFGLGYLDGRDAARAALPIPAPQAPLAEVAPATPALAGQTGGAFVASKNGTKYYLPTCSGAKRISEANKVWFDSAAAATAAGYAPAANCPGL